MCLFFEDPVPLHREGLNYVIFVCHFLLESNDVGDEIFLIHLPVMLPLVHTFVCVRVVAFDRGRRSCGSIVVRIQREVNYSVFNTAHPP